MDQTPIADLAVIAVMVWILYAGSLWRARRRALSIARREAMQRHPAGRSQADL